MSAPLIAFIGTTPNIGTTSAAFAAACRLAERSGEEVGFLCLNLRSAKIHRFIGQDRPPATLDSIRPELTSASLSSAQLRRACIQPDGHPLVHVLAGNQMRDQAEFYSFEETEHLLDIARQTFPAVVADAGCYWDNAATIGAMRAASSRILCTTGALSHFQEDCNRWIRQVSPLFGILPEQFDLLAIQSPSTTGGYRMKEMEKETRLSVIAEFKTNQAFYESLDRGRYQAWLKQDAVGRIAMDLAADKLAERHGIRCRPVKDKQPWFRKLKAHRGELRI
ncbi:hypothetical protein ACTHPH_12150 [Paenibacillus pasadenensis]|uniref:Cellulose biosynthesis protein BcsQ n=1 Tax=Paenibacillus pasadenensis TaxID=217090 RepID=A0A2N5N3H1_9BACL|nr:hypothetical protein [Paenibacillus pasadenensis]PLT44887.1 hypothetical protein B8V81_3318 [Paenibacillus pasadenensis]